MTALLKVSLVEALIEILHRQANRRIHIVRLHFLASNHLDQLLLQRHIRIRQLEHFLGYFVTKLRLLPLDLVLKLRVVKALGLSFSHKYFHMVVLILAWRCNLALFKRFEKRGAIE